MKNNRSIRRQGKQKLGKATKNTVKISHFTLSKISTLFGLGLSILIFFFGDFKTIKEKFIDEPPASNFPYTKIETISELKRLNDLYDNSGESIHIDRMVEIIAHNFHELRLKNPDNFNDTFNQVEFINSANIVTSTPGLPYMGLINTKIISRDNWHDIEFVARIKEVPVENFKSKFNVWWKDQVILNDHKKNKYTRRSVILNYALHRLNKRYPHANDTEIINRFEFSAILSNYNPNSGILTLEGVVFRPSKSTQGVVLRNEDVLLFENIRAISEEIAETLANSFVSANN